jgi:hypothetical protein
MPELLQPLIPSSLGHRTRMLEHRKSELQIWSNGGEPKRSESMWRNCSVEDRVFHVKSRVGWGMEVVFSPLHIAKILVKK